MKNTFSHIAQIFRSTLLLGLFVMALTLQGIHQFENPAQAPKECGNVDSHIHQDPDAHSCDLCAFKITHHPVSTDYPHVTIWETILSITLQQDIFRDVLQLQPLRGPPVC